MGKSKNLFEDETPDVDSKPEDFATLFEQSLGSAGKRLRVGDKFSGQILSIGKEQSFVATGTARDAAIASLDLLDENKQPKFKVGESIPVVVTRVKGDEIWVTRQGSRSAPTEIENLEDAFDMELPVEGKVTEVVNGGYRVSIQGQPGFCPFSQIDSQPVADPSQMIGKKFDFLITQLDAKKRNLVVSRRKLLDLKRAESEGGWLQTHKVGDILSGTVTRTEQFGAFVNLGDGVEGLVHISEIGFSRLKHASDGVRPGDPVQVKVLKIDDEGDRLRISLSIKSAGGVQDPWLEIVQKYPVGAIFDGVVDKKEVFGLFVVLTAGVNGLLPRSKWRDSLEAQSYEAKKKGDTIRVRVDEIKFEERKISLGLPTEADDDSWKDHQTNQKLGTLAAAFAVANKKS